MNAAKHNLNFIALMLLSCLLVFSAGCLTSDDNDNGDQAEETVITNSQGLAKSGATNVNLVGGDDEGVTDAPVTVSTKDDTVTAEIVSSEYTYGYASGKPGDDLYLFVQKVDANKVQFDKEDQVCDTCSEELGSVISESDQYQDSELYQESDIFKPTPKSITSSDGSASIVITDMQLSKDVTVAVTPYKEQKYVPKLQELLDAGYQIVGGADINIVDSKGNPTTAEDACFCGNVVLKSSKVIGETTAADLAGKINSDQGDLALYVLKDKKWTAVDQPQASLTKQDGVWVLSNTARTVRLYPFVYAYKPQAGTVFSGTVSGTVTDQNATPLSGALVGFEQGGYTVSDANGTYSLSYSGFTADVPISKKVYANKAGFQNTVKIVTGLSPTAANAQVNLSLSTNQNLVDIQGVTKTENDQPISGAGVTLDAPLVLNQVDIQGQTVTVGENDSANYSWMVSDNGEELSSSSGTGMNVYTVPSTLISNMAEGEVSDLTVTVSHSGSGNATYTEFIAGQIQKMDSTADIYLKASSQASQIKITSDKDGTYAFVNIDQGLLPFINLQASAVGYQPSSVYGPFTQEQVVDSVLTQDVTLLPSGSVSEYYEGFENESLDENWTLTNNSTLVGWQIQEAPEQITVAEGILNEVLFPDRDTVDVAGEILFIQEGNATEGNATAVVGFTKEGNATETTVTVNILDTDNDGNFETLQNQFATYEQGQYDVWLQSPVDALSVGSQVTVSYPDPADTQVNLLPAYAGDWILWYGNPITGTISDTDENTSLEPNSGTAESPVIDLSNYSFATAELKTWFEVESVEVAAGQFDQMHILVAVVDEQVPAGEPIIIADGTDSYSLKQGEYNHLTSFNPDVEPPGMQKSFLNYSSGGPNAVPVWISRQINLNPFVGHKIRIMFAFATEDTLYNGFRGWGIDEARVMNIDNGLDFQLNTVNGTETINQSTGLTKQSIPSRAGNE